MNENEKEEKCKQVKQFLIEIKSLVYQKGLYIKERKINRDALLEIGLTAKQREESILDLSTMDYCSGPHTDNLAPGIFWIFGKLINDIEVYIKIKIAGEPGEERALCLSFHKAEKPLDYPLSKG
jgi:hypothetical protein